MIYPTQHNFLKKEENNDSLNLTKLYTGFFLNLAPDLPFLRSFTFKNLLWQIFCLPPGRYKCPIPYPVLEPWNYLF
jgi:hypothetical protein